MLRQIKVADLCNELEKQLEKLQYSEDSMRRYRKVFREFAEYTGDCYYSQSKGTDFLLWKFNQLGGFVTSGEHSKNEMYYFRVIRSLAEYFNFGNMNDVIPSLDYSDENGSGSVEALKVLKELYSDLLKQA